MKLEVRLFARARDLAGKETVAVDLPDVACVADLRAALGKQFPGLQPLLASLHVAVGTEYADNDMQIDADSDVACFPPVSGG